MNPLSNLSEWWSCCDDGSGSCEEKTEASTSTDPPSNQRVRRRLRLSKISSVKELGTIGHPRVALCSVDTCAQCCIFSKFQPALVLRRASLFFCLEDLPHAFSFTWHTTTMTSEYDGDKWVEAYMQEVRCRNFILVEGAEPSRVLHESVIITLIVLLLWSHVVSLCLAKSNTI